jgi:hypothetical protein
LRGRARSFGELEARRKTFGVSLGSFTIDKKSDALFER